MSRFSVCIYFDTRVDLSNISRPLIGQDEVDFRPPMNDGLLVPYPEHPEKDSLANCTHAYGRIDFRSDGKSAYEPPVSFCLDIGMNSIKA